MQDDADLKKIRDDLQEDATLLIYLSGDLAGKCRRFSQKNYAEVAPVGVALTEAVSSLKERSASFAAGVSKLDNMAELPALYGQKQNILHDIHAITGLVSGARVYSHRQSPVIDQSVGSAETEDGKILAHFNDYTRDQHIIGTIFEKQYRRHFVPIPLTVPVYTYATTSGMAAMTTAALMVMGEAPKDAPILVGSSCYFETKQLLSSLFGERVISVDLSDSTCVAKAITRHRPVAVFADTIGNEPMMRLVDIPGIIYAMKDALYSQVYVVADISASSFMRPLIRGVGLPRGVMLVGVESQNKFLQFGLDRVTAGVVWGTGFQAMKLYDYRDHAGTICSDASIAALPTPMRNLARRYMARLARNAGILFRLLHDSDVVSRLGLTVRYPEETGFCGAYLMISWKERPLKTFDGYINKVMKIAQQRGIAMVHGTSFGFHTTRIYTVAMHTLYEKPFLRISPGTETEQEMHGIARLLIDAL